jgi:hypothetical protein
MMTRVALSIFASFLLVACDRWDGLSVRNDGEQPIRIVWQFPGGREYAVFAHGRVLPDDATVAPGDTAEAGAVGGPPDPRPDVIVRAFNASGTLVYCRRLKPDEYREMTAKAPLSLKPGDLRCG